jgi:FMN phosphatase YigB (HAD superfamily)
VGLRAVLLDLDGTLVDHEGAAAEALRRWLPPLGVSVTDDVVALWAAVQERHLVGWREGRISFAEQRRRRLRDFLTACARLGLPPAAVLHVGDRYDLDVVAARAAGLPAVHLDRSGVDRRDGAIGSLAELAAA